MLTSGSTRGDNGTVKTSLGDQINLDGGVAARVVDGPGVDRLDGHVCYGNEPYVSILASTPGRKQMQLYNGGDDGDGIGSHVPMKPIGHGISA